MNKRKALGKGLSALIQPPAAGEGGGDVEQIAIGVIDPNPYQPRVDFDDEEIAGLAESIQKQGLLQPIVLRKSGGGRYQIISGERRFRAFKRLKRDAVPCIVKTDVTDNEMLELALVENIQREQLNEIEKALAYQKLIRQCGYTHDQLAKQVGKGRTAITNALRLLNLPEEVQSMLRKNEMQMGHARALLSLDGAENQIDAARRIVDGKLTVREAELLGRGGEKSLGDDDTAATLSSELSDKSLDKSSDKSSDKSLDRSLDKSSGKSPKEIRPHSPDTADALEKIQYKFGTPIKLKETSGGRGRVEIEYFSEDDLARVFDLLLGGS